ARAAATPVSAEGMAGAAGELAAAVLAVSNRRSPAGAGAGSKPIPSSGNPTKTGNPPLHPRRQPTPIPFQAAPRAPPKTPPPPPAPRPTPPRRVIQPPVRVPHPLRPHPPPLVGDTQHPPAAVQQMPRHRHRRIRRRKRRRVLGQLRQQVHHIA